MNQKGFTLIELIVVIAIIAILAAVAVPSYLNVQNRAEEQMDRANAGIIVNAINTHNTLVSSGISTAALVPTSVISSSGTASGFNAACTEVTIDENMSDTDFQAACAYITYATAGDVAVLQPLGEAEPAGN